MRVVARPCAAAFAVWELGFPFLLFLRRAPEAWTSAPLLGEALFA
jgi:hypothetical protein